MALAAMLIGVLDLKVGARLKEVKSEGVDLMVALDVSTSMEAEDTGSSRIDLAKQSIQRLVNALDGDAWARHFRRRCVCSVPHHHGLRSLQTVPGWGHDGLGAGARHGGRSRHRSLHSGL